MSLLYRVIPDQWGYLCEKGYLNVKDGLTTEDLFYELGYLNKSEHFPYLSITTDPILGYHVWQGGTGAGMYFFTNPWDAVKTYRYINSSYTYFSNYGVRICEYDIPDEIIAKSWQGDGYYSGEAISEIKIPLELILNDADNILTKELEAQLKEVVLIEAKEAFNRLFPMLQIFGRNLTEEQINSIKNYYLSSEKQDDLNTKRFKNAGIFKKSSYITGRSFYLTLYDFLSIRKDAKLNYELLIPLSNDVLTEENLQEYLERFPKR